jgi:hypothetical protein
LFLIVWTPSGVRVLSITYVGKEAPFGRVPVRECRQNSAARGEG